MCTDRPFAISGLCAYRLNADKHIAFYSEPISQLTFAILYAIFSVISAANDSKLGRI